MVATLALGEQCSAGSEFLQLGRRQDHLCNLGAAVDQELVAKRVEERSTSFSSLKAFEHEFSLPFSLPRGALPGSHSNGAVSGRV